MEAKETVDDRPRAGWLRVTALLHPTVNPYEDFLVNVMIPARAGARGSRVARLVRWLV